MEPITHQAANRVATKYISNGVARASLLGYITANEQKEIAQIKANEARDAAIPQAIAALEKLIDLYVANPGTEHEFISGITPKHACYMTKKERAECDVWSAWDEARAALAALKGE